MHSDHTMTTMIHKIDITEIRKISNKYDLMDLICTGAPDDEYDPESREIIKYMIEHQYRVTQQDMRNIILRIYSVAFYDDCININNPKKSKEVEDMSLDIVKYVLTCC
jgi:hypothetical protein